MVMDAEARFRELFHTAYPALRRFALHRGLTGADADDLVASTLTVAWRRLGQVPTDNPLPWLYAVAGNVRRNQRRSDARRSAFISRATPSARDVWVDRSTLTNDSDAPDADALRAALARLGDEDREILILIAWDELSPAEAATVLGCSPAAARTRLHRARRRLADALGYDPRKPRLPPAPTDVVPTESEIVQGGPR
jgi:RNA polymerase sigma-70 factor (ECF subfamily)